MRYLHVGLLLLTALVLVSVFFAQGESLTVLTDPHCKVDGERFKSIAALDSAGAIVGDPYRLGESRVNPGACAPLQPVALAAGNELIMPGGEAIRLTTDGDIGNDGALWSTGVDLGFVNPLLSTWLSLIPILGGTVVFGLAWMVWQSGQRREPEEAPDGGS